jgi:hypothetical protein
LAQIDGTKRFEFYGFHDICPSQAEVGLLTRATGSVN